MDLVSVVIPAYNSEKWIKTTLNSVLAQSYPELEIIVVDDGSSDRTAELAEHTLNGFPGSWKVLRQANKGVSAARNSGWRVAHGSWIQFLDSDDVLAPDKVKLQAAVAQKSPQEIAIVYSSWQRVAGEEDRLLPVEEAQTPQLDSKPPPASLLITKNNIQIGSVLVRREWLESSQGFKEQMPIYEDTEFLIRIAAAGGRPRAFGPISTFSSTVNQGNSAYSWNTMPRSAPGPQMGWPSTRMRPVLGFTNPAAMLSNVDFPHPLGPSRHTKRRGGMASEKSWMASDRAPPLAVE